MVDVFSVREDEAELLRRRYEHEKETYDALFRGTGSRELDLHSVVDFKYKARESAFSFI